MPLSLMKLAETEGISIEYWNYCEPIKAIYFCGDAPVIGLDKSLQTNFRECRCVLAEEIGHHFTCSGNHVLNEKNYFARIYTCKIERKALLWAANYLIPDDHLIDVIKRGASVYDLEDMFNVTHWMMLFKLNYIHLCEAG